MITFILCAGTIACLTLAQMAHSEKNYGEMRALLATGVLFACMWLARL